MIGTKLGHYELIECVGAGGMGEVFRARDTRLMRDVAIKLLRPRWAADRAALQRLRAEAETVASLDHPNIVTIYSVEEFDERHFLTMEYLEGHTLAQTLRSGRTLPYPELFRVGLALADALRAAHDRRIVHRDLKPANVMLTRDGRVKVLDFGLAKLLELGRSSLASTRPLTQEGQVVGTVPYMSPEQLRAEGVECSSDVFSFGVVLYELATGASPFAGESDFDVGSSILRDTPRPMRDYSNRLPAEFCALVGRCLEKDSAARPQSGGELYDALRALRWTAGDARRRTADAQDAGRSRWSLRRAIMGALGATWASFRTV